MRSLINNFKDRGDLQDDRPGPAGRDIVLRVPGGHAQPDGVPPQGPPPGI